MLKRIILWIIPLLLVAIVAAYFVLEPSLGAHASTIHSMLPQYWNGQ